MDKSNTNESESSTPNERCSASPASSLSTSTASSGRSSASVPKGKRRFKPTNLSNTTASRDGHCSTDLETEVMEQMDGSNVITLNVSTIMGRTFQIRISPEDTVQQVKQSIQREVGINSEAQVLVYREKALVNDRAKIVECDIRDGATLQLVVQMVGGTGVPGGGGCVGRGRALTTKKEEDQTKSIGSEDEVVLLLCKQDDEVYVLEVHLKDGKKVTTGEKRFIGGAGAKGEGSGTSIELAVAGCKGVDVNMEFLCEEEAVKLFQEANLHLGFGLLDDKTRKNGILAGRFGFEDIMGAGGKRKDVEEKNGAFRADEDDDDDFFRPISASSTISSTSLSTFLSLATTMTTSSSSISSPTIGSAFSSRPLSASSIRTASRPGSGQNSQLLTPRASSSAYPPSSLSNFSSLCTSATSSLTETRSNRNYRGKDLRWNHTLGRFLPSVSASPASLPLRGQRPATAICVTRIQNRLSLEWDWECLTKVRPKSAGIVLGTLRKPCPESNADDDEYDDLSTKASKGKRSDKATNGRSLPEYLKFPTPPATPPCVTRRHTHRSPRTSITCESLPLSHYVDVPNDNRVNQKSAPDEKSIGEFSDAMPYPLSRSPLSAGTRGISPSESNVESMDANSMINLANTEEVPVKACVSFSANDLRDGKSTQYKRKDNITGSGKMASRRKSATRSHQSDAKARPDVSVQSRNDAVHKKKSSAGTQPRSANSRSKLASFLPSRSPSENQHPLPHTPRAKCAVCHKRLPLSVSSTFRCRCGKTFCASHRYTDRHVCSFDYKAEGKITIAKENPWVGKRRIEKC